MKPSKSFSKYLDRDVYSYPVGSTQSDGDDTGTIRKKPCIQCKQTSILQYESKFGGPSASCLNNCGPEGLIKMLRF
mgnify:CR=1 FL=1|jgi:hypothetical protein